MTGIDGEDTTATVALECSYETADEVSVTVIEG